MKKQQITLSRKKAMRKVVWMKAAFLLLMFVTALYGRAQDTGSKLISLELKEAPLGEALKQFSNVSGYKVNFPSEDVGAYRVSASIHQLAPLAALQKILEGKPFEYEVNQNFITVRKVKPATTRKVRNIEGRVVDEKGDPLPGANIRGIDSPFGAISDIKGNFTCKVMEETHALEVSFVGMQTEKVSVKGRTHVNVIMHEDKQQLGDVVVTGYQRISRERSTASFGFIDSEQLTRQMHSDLTSSLEGQIAGLRMDINPNNGDMSPILRGIGTFSKEVGSHPLIVVDDMPTDLTLSEINPYNVESITVLKDAAAASIYGALAANGVIVVTTNQAKREGANVSINADWFITTKPNFKSLNLASTSEIIDYQTAVFDANVAEKGSASGYLSGFKSGYYNPLYQLYLDRENGVVSTDEVNTTLNQWRNNDYYKEYRDNAWRTAVTQRYNVSVSQKNSNNNHYLSFNYEVDNPRTVSSKSNKISLYYKSSYAITNWMTLNAGVDVRMGRSTTPDNSYTNYNIQQRYERILDDGGDRYISPYVKMGSYPGYNGSVVSQAEGVSPYKSFGFNVLDALDENKTKRHDVGIRPFVSLQARFLKMFKYNFMYQYEWNKSKSEQFDSEDSYSMRMVHNSMIDTDGKSHLPKGGRYFQTELGSNRYTVRNQIDFDKSWKNHAVTAIVGLEFRENKIPKPTRQLLYGYDPQTLTSDYMNWQAYRDGVGTSALSGSTITLSGLSATLQESCHRYASFYANAGYSLMSRYNLSGSIRWDQADLFGLDIRKQRHPLWSVGASWIVSEESFMKDFSWLDYLKVRMTYGINGNVDQSSTTYFVVKQKTQSNPIKTTYLTYEDDDLPNPKLRWEKTATYNVGLDFRLFNNVISGSLEYYNRQASDLLVRRYMDPTLGAKSRVVNNGEMRNRGVEFSLTANIIRKKDWNFAVNFNFDHNKNKMLKVDHSDADNASSFIMSPQNYFMEGTSYNTLWAYRIDRIENGYPVAVDKDGNDLVKFNEDGTVANIVTSSSLKGTDDLVNLGSVTPKFSGSLAFRLNYKNFDLNAFFVYAGGNKLRNSVVKMDDQIGDQTLKGISNRWSADVSDTQVRMYHDMPQQVKSYSGTFQYWWQYGDINVKDAGYVKLRSLSLGYNLPTAICQHLRINSLKVKVQVNNLFTWCKAGSDIDPESYNMNGGTRGMASPKTYSIGLSTSF